MLVIVVVDGSHFCLGQPFFPKGVTLNWLRHAYLTPQWNSGSMLLALLGEWKNLRCLHLSKVTTCSKHGRLANVLLTLRTPDYPHTSFLLYAEMFCLQLTEPEWQQTLEQKHADQLLSGRCTEENRRLCTVKDERWLMSVTLCRSVKSLLSWSL